MFVPLDFFRCSNCAEWLRPREARRGTACRCPFCDQQQVIPGVKKGFFGKLLLVVGGGSGETHTEANVCYRCRRDLPPLVWWDSVTARSAQAPFPKRRG